MNSLIVVCGPTATGKTDYALRLAQEKNGELVSADSRQLYKYLSIGTGKDIPQNSKLETRNSKLKIESKKYTVGYYKVNNIPLWLYDVISPDQQCSAFDYAQLARMVIKDIWQREKLPVLVGGTGLYVKAVVDGFTTNISPDWNLRKKLEHHTITELQHHLSFLNAERLITMNQSDINNPRRLIRAIEIEKGKKLHTKKSGQKHNETITNMVSFIGLKCPNIELYRRIDKRVDNRIQQGVLSEIESVLKRGYSWNDPGLTTIGYKQVRAYFEKKETLEEVAQKWKFAEHAYARRQMTWFKKDKRIQWVET
jgi:tRNA dimethylallyltransferase